MNKVQLILDSACDLGIEFAKKNNIELVPFYVSFDGTTYYKEEIELNNEKFYKTLNDENVFPKTSLPPISDYIDRFRPYLEKGMDILCMCLSSKLSGSFQSAYNAGNILQEEYPDNKIIVIDSLLATGSYGVYALQARKLLDDGVGIEEVAERINKNKQEGEIYLALETLEYLVKGGRISNVSAIAGNILNIKPIIMLKEGKLSPLSKARGRKKVLSQLENHVYDFAKEHDMNEYSLISISAQAKDELESVVKNIEETTSLKFNYPEFNLGPTIGSHTGPNVIAIGIVKNL